MPGKYRVRQRWMAARRRSKNAAGASGNKKGSVAGGFTTPPSGALSS
jgi:hypothetical protein